MTTSRPTGVLLRRRRLGVMDIVFFTVSAVAPLSVLGGAVVPTYALSGVTAVPLSFVVIAIPLAIFSVGYAAMSRYVANAGAFYSYLAHGLGRTAAVAGALIALVAYNTLQIGIFGILGPVVAEFVASATGLTLPWWSLIPSSIRNGAAGSSTRRLTRSWLVACSRWSSCRCSSSLPFLV